MKATYVKTIFTAVFLLTYGVFCYGQATQKIYNGYIITNQNDTLRGELNVMTLLLNTTPHSVGFRKKTEYNFKNYYSPNEIKSFVLDINKTEDSLIFYAKKVTLNLRKTTIKVYSSKIPSIWHDTTLFLRAYILGDMSLYQTTDDLNKPYFFIEKKSSGIVSLIDTKEQFTDNTKRKSIDFREKLAQLFNDCPSYQSYNFKKTHLSAPDLIQLVEDYNEKMSKKTPTYIVKQTQKKMVYGAFVGIHKSSVEQNRWVHTNTNLTPSVGAWLSTQIFKKSPLTFNAELEYCSLKSTATRYESGNLWHYSDSTNVNLNYINANIAFGYDLFKVKSSKIYSKIGASAGLLMFDKTEQYTAIVDDLLGTQLNNFYFYPRKIDLGIFGGLGFQMKNCAIEARFRMSNGYSSEKMVKTTVTNASINLFWRFSNNKPYPKSQLKNTFLLNSTTKS